MIGIYWKLFIQFLVYLISFGVALPVQIFQRLSEEAGNGVEENQDRCLTFLRKFRKYLSRIYNANATEIDKVNNYFHF